MTNDGIVPVCDFKTPQSELIKGQYLVKNTTDIRIDVIFYD